MDGKDEAFMCVNDYLPPQVKPAVPKYKRAGRRVVDKHQKSARLFHTDEHYEALAERVRLGLPLDPAKTVGYLGER